MIEILLMMSYNSNLIIQMMWRNINPYL